MDGTTITSAIAHSQSISGVRDNWDTSLNVYMYGPEPSGPVPYFFLSFRRRFAILASNTVSVPSASL